MSHPRSDFCPPTHPHMSHHITPLHHATVYYYDHATDTCIKSRDHAIIRSRDHAIMPHFCLFKQPKMLALNYFLLAWFYCTKFLLCCIAAVHASMQPVAKKTRTEDSNCSVQSVDTSSTVLPRATQPDRHLSNSSDQHQQVWYGPGGVTHIGNPPATPAPQPKSLEPPIFVDVIARLPPTPPPARVLPQLS